MPTPLFTANDPNNPAKRRSRDAFQHASDVVWLARRGTKKSIRVIMAIMQNPKVSALTRLKAAEAILERGWGTADKGIDPLAGLTQAQIKETANRLKALHSRDQARITIHSDKTVVTSDQGVLTDGAQEGRVIQDHEGYAVELERGGPSSQTVQQNDGPQKPTGEEADDEVSALPLQRG